MKDDLKHYGLSVLLALAAVTLTFFVSIFFYKMNTGYLLRNGVYIIFYFLGLLYIYFYSARFNKLDYDNKEHPVRFFLSFGICMIFVMIFPLMDARMWFFVGIAVTLSLFSNSLIGIYSISGMIMYSLLLTGNTSITVFFVYFLSSLIAVLLFQDIEHNFNFGLSLFGAMLVMFVLETAGFILLANIELQAEQFVMPIVNIVVNCLILFFILKFFNLSISNRYTNQYLVINDQGYAALTGLREKSEEEYFRSIHTAYLAERMAALTGCNVNLTKNCAYYHRIKAVFGLSDEECINYLSDNNFPPEAKEKLMEYFTSDKLIYRETGIVYLCDLFIYMIMSVFKANPQASIDYEAVVNSLISKEFNQQILSDSLITRQDINHIKEVFLKETLYYDFLR